jgi:hypothetical protein
VALESEEAGASESEVALESDVSPKLDVASESLEAYLVALILKFRLNKE